MTQHARPYKTTSGECTTQINKSAPHRPFLSPTHQPTCPSMTALKGYDALHRVVDVVECKSLTFLHRIPNFLKEKRVEC